MRPTGIVRRIDDLGRVVIPKELRRSIGIKEGDPLEIFYNNDGIVMRKYSTMDEVGEAAQVLQNWIADQDSDAHTSMTSLEMDIFKRLLEIANKTHGENDEEEE